MTGKNEYIIKHKNSHGLLVLPSTVLSNDYNNVDIRDESESFENWKTEVMSRASPAEKKMGV